MTTSYAIAEEFRAFRFSPDQHLGLGDIRLTIGQQEALVARVRKIEDKVHSLEGALQEVRSLLHQSEMAHELVDRVLGGRRP